MEPRDPNLIQKAIRVWANMKFLQLEKPSIIFTDLFCLEKVLIPVLGDICRTSDELEEFKSTCISTLARGLFNTDNFPSYTNCGEKYVDILLMESKNVKTLVLDLYDNLQQLHKEFLELDSRVDIKHRIKCRIERTLTVRDYLDRLSDAVFYDESELRETIRNANLKSQLNDLITKNDDLSGSGSGCGSSSSSIQGLYIPGGKFVLCSVCLPFYIVYNHCFTILYVLLLFVLLQQLVVMTMLQE